MWGVFIKEKYLIVNADDLGLDSNINKGIAQCCRQGIVRSVSIVAGGRKFDEALVLMKDLPAVGIGVHLCLVEEKPVLSATAVSTLVDAQGKFPRDYRHFIFKLVMGKIRLSEAELEFEAQIRKVLDSGIKPTHLDAHQYLHLLPGVLEIVLRMAVKYDIKWIRYPSGIKNTDGFMRKGAVKKAWIAFHDAPAAQKIAESGLRRPDHSYGADTTGHLNKAALLSHLRHIVDGTNDLTCHPGRRPEDPLYLAWHYQWEEEMKALSDPEVAAAVNSLKIRLGNYAY
ncbi:MAG: ChbG/HpnK family deacetylase [Candidatus Omnitrophica bacterium]|nr:ChbG/HpnK family deacetylase [Candidatus Omnitrophota bacterium]